MHTDIYRIHIYQTMQQISENEVLPTLFTHYYHKEIIYLYKDSKLDKNDIDESGQIKGQYYR